MSATTIHIGWRLSAPKRLRSRQRPLVVEALAERDGWACWLCDEPIDPDLPRGAAHSASIDHVLPRSLGGGNGLDNLRLAHRRCNSKRGRRQNGGGVK